jgi:carboxyl-terminal processing protease
MVLRLKGIQAGIELYADRTKLFGRKLPSDSLSKLKGEQGSVVELTIYRKSADKKSKSKKKRGLFL